ncbi:thioredoxin-like protein, partial [Gorgonomyces haynaldii]
MLECMYTPEDVSTLCQMSKNNVVSVDSQEQFANFLQSQPIKAINFWASWHAPCLQLNTVFEELSRKYPQIEWITIEAEEYPDESEAFEIETVPTVVFYKQKELERVQGYNPPMLLQLAEKYSKQTVETVKISQQGPPLEQRLKQLVVSQPMMIFIKGTPTEPRCGFSRQLIELLDGLSCAYGSFNILADDDIRQGLKTFSNWPTFPQVYINGEFVGGLDIVKELIESGEFQQMVPKEEDLNTRLQKLVSKAPLMVFIKGTPEQPRCGFSRQLIGHLDGLNVKYETFDILSDEEVRQGLKTFSNWPTFPQVYVNGELVGGLDIVKEMIENGEFQEMIPLNAS